MRGERKIFESMTADGELTGGLAWTSTVYDPPPPTLFSSLRKYAKILRVSLTERLAYRADFIISTFLRFLPMLTTILLWQAVYAGTANQELAGFRLSEMISYLLLVHISRMFSSMPGLAGGIARDIRDGQLKKYLLQPIDMLAYLVTYRMAHKVAYIAMSALPYAILFLLCWQYLPPCPDWGNLAGYLASLLLGFVIGFYFEAMIGMVGFWFLEVTSFLYVVGTLTFFFSGQMFPFQLLPPFWAGLLEAMPFKYLAYFPAMIFLGKVGDEVLLRELLIQLAWAVVFFVLCRWLYRLGLRRYSAFGG
jgi:ABC-2 type transport system permease protein